MAKFTDTCPACKSSFTNYTVRPLKYCSVVCQLDSLIINEISIARTKYLKESDK